MYDYVTLDKKERQILYRILAFIPPNYEFDFDEVVHSSNPDAYPSALYGYIESFLIFFILFFGQWMKAIFRLYINRFYLQQFVILYLFVEWGTERKSGWHNKVQ